MRSALDLRFASEKLAQKSIYKYQTPNASRNSVGKKEAAMRIARIPFEYYQHFDQDFTLDVPAKGMGGWKKAELDIDVDATALVVMHAWDCGTRSQYPGWHRAVEYIPRADKICETVLPSLLRSARNAGMPVMHIVTTGEYLSKYPGYARTEALAGAPERQHRMAPRNAYSEAIGRFRTEHVFPGPHNQEDIARGFAALDFPESVKPLDSEDMATDTRQLATLCQTKGVSHLIYTGFAINGCLLTSPGGMLDMSRLGFVCSAIRQAVTAIENRETAETEQAKELALWFVSLQYGLVYDADAFIEVLNSLI
jgi:nicotinamidase-related amidase